MSFKDIRISVKTNAAKNLVSEKGDRYIIETIEKAEQNKANLMVKKLLSEYLQKEEKEIQIIKGSSTPSKIIRIYNF